MAALILDAGALIACERDDRRFWTAFKASQSAGGAIVPAPVVAQVWRDGARQARLASLLKTCDVRSLDDRHARRVGELCRAAGTADVVDACVAVFAAELNADVATSDPDDISQLMDAAQARGRVLSL